MGAPPVQPRQLSPNRGPAPMACDAPGAPTHASHHASCAAASPAASCDGGSAHHHLLRHVLSPEQCSDALHHFGTTDSKAAARMVNRMSQRELRDMFAKVYNVHTNSNNNTWLRRKLLEAVGASRRFYAAANKTGRPKQRRGAAAAAAKPHSPKAAPPAPTAGAQHVTIVTSRHQLEAHPAQRYHHAPQQVRHAPPAGTALPAGSPRALYQRRRPAATSGSATGLDAHVSGAAPPPPPHRRHHLLGWGTAAAFADSPNASEAGETCSEGSEGHPRALARRSYDCGGASHPHSASGTPTSASAVAQAAVGPYSRHVPMPTSGSDTSLRSTQCALAAPPRGSSTGAGVPALNRPPATLPDGKLDLKLPRGGSFAALNALLASYPSAEPATAPQPALALQRGLSLDLGGGLWLPGDSCVSSAPLGKLCDEEWLTWGDLSLPSLF